jgi:hypothetical protein
MTTKQIITAALNRRKYDRSRHQHQPGKLPPPNIPAEMVELYQREYDRVEPKKTRVPTGKAKKNVTVSVSIDLQDEARGLGIELSAACEEGIKLAVDRVRSSNGGYRQTRQPQW